MDDNNNIYDALGRLVADAVATAVATSVRPLIETISNLQSKVDTNEKGEGSQIESELEQYCNWDKVVREKWGANYKVH